MNVGVVQAAGGVVIRDANADGEIEVLVVHRPRYDDWSLPKGKLERDETHEDAAQREVAEETGVVVELGDELPSHEYVDRHGRDKVVRWWIMRPVGSVPWIANDEVDDVRWVPARDAFHVLTYDADRRLVAAVAGVGSGGAT